MDELEAVTDLINARHVHDIGVGDESVARMRMYWTEEARDLARNNLLVVATDGRMAAYADFGDWEPFTTSVFIFAVHPDFIGADLEEPLFDWAELRARESMARAASGERVTLKTVFWAENTNDAERLRQRGFMMQRDWHRMMIDMTEPPAAPVWPDGIAVRTLNLESPTDIERVQLAWEEAQRDEWGFTSLTAEDWQRSLVDYEVSFDPSLWFLAIDTVTDDIIGYVLCRWERPGNPEHGNVRYVAVRPAHRRRGIARALLLHTFGEFFRRGKTRVDLAADAISPTGADKLYANIGMSPFKRSHIYEKVLGDATGAV